MTEVISHAPIVRDGQREHASRGRRARRKAPGRGVLKDVVLAFFGLLGMLAVGWLIFAQVTGASIVVFETGSMAPVIPQGGASVSFPAKAADLHVGDIVTAQLDDATRPVTHRIVSIAPDPGRPNGKLLTLKGDANATPDLFPYPVTDVLRVAVGGPGFGTVATVLKSPIGIAGGFAIVALLVLWAFWPQPTVRKGSHAHRHSASG
jgi:signal peptidase